MGFDVGRLMYYSLRGPYIERASSIDQSSLSMFGNLSLAWEFLHHGWWILLFTLLLWRVSLCRIWLDEKIFRRNSLFHIWLGNEFHPIKEGICILGGKCIPQRMRALNFPRSKENKPVKLRLLS